MFPSVRISTYFKYVFLVRKYFHNVFMKTWWIHSKQLSLYNIKDIYIYILQINAVLIADYCSYVAFYVERLLCTYNNLYKIFEKSYTEYLKIMRNIPWSAVTLNTKDYLLFYLKIFYKYLWKNISIKVTQYIIFVDLHNDSSFVDREQLSTEHYLLGL